MAPSINRKGYTTFKISSNTLGITDENGYEENYEYFWEPIYTDQYGSNVPEDEQYDGKTLTLSGTLVKFDNTVLRPLLAGGDGAYNTLGTIGELLIGDTLYFELIAQDPAGNTRTYHRCRFDNASADIGRRITRYDFSIIVRGNAGTFFTDA